MDCVISRTSVSILAFQVGQHGDRCLHGADVLGFIVSISSCFRYLLF